MSPLEKCVRAVDRATFGELTDGRCEAIARAVLLAVREPGERAEDAGDNAPYRHLVWERMIDAILEGE